jgi:hypothetical protein
MLNRTTSLIIGLFLLSASLTACGGSDTLFGEYQVNDIDVIAKEIEVGEEVRVEVFFETKRGAGNNVDEVDVVIFLPAAVEFVEGSSSIYDDTTDDRDARSPDSVVECEGGGSYVVYNFDDDELEDTRLSVGEWGLRFEARGVSTSESVEFEAAADENQFFSCMDSFPGEENEVIRVVPAGTT